jgi:hypothetical protein
MLQLSDISRFGSCCCTYNSSLACGAGPISLLAYFNFQLGTTGVGSEFNKNRPEPMNLLVQDLLY